MPFSAPALGTLAPDLPCDLLIERTQHLAGYTALLSFAGAPAMSVPLFQSPEGLPIGSQFAARPGGERSLLELAYQLEVAQPWAGRWPAIALARR
jgi:amidase